jgi:hypothetical protein
MSGSDDKMDRSYAVPVERYSQGQYDEIDRTRSLTGKPDLVDPIRGAEITDPRAVELYVCGVCGTVDDPASWGSGREYEPACRCED